MEAMARGITINGFRYGPLYCSICESKSRGRPKIGKWLLWTQIRLITRQRSRISVGQRYNP